MQELFPGGYTLLHDSAPPHTAASTKAFLQREGVKVENHPPESPDLNMIETAFSLLKSRVSFPIRIFKKNFEQSVKIQVTELNPTTMDELISAIHSSWLERLTLLTCQKLILRMPRRMQEVLRVRGSPTRIN